MKIVLISCSKTKQNYPCAAKDMYAPSELFSLSYAYGKQIADLVLILSAKYGVLEENDPISPYEMALATFSEEQRRAWYKGVCRQLREKCDLDKDEFVILTGKDYYLGLLPFLKHYSLPLIHQSLGQRMNTLKQWLSQLSLADQNQKQVPMEKPDRFIDNCEELHWIFNTAQRYTGNDIAAVPFENGIYIMLERGETYRGRYHRIVRVGTHTSSNRLKKRLEDHFLKENKDGSIFRKNIGKAILNKAKDPYLRIWSMDTSKPENMRYVDAGKQAAIEREVTAYMMQNIKFAVFRVDNKEQRLRLEEAIISSLHRGKDFHASATWLGNYSSEEEIRSSGMWLKQGLDAAPLTPVEMQFLRERTAIPSPSMQNAEPSAKKIDWKGNEGSFGTAKIREHIADILQAARAQGKKDCILTSGDIHRSMGLSSRMPAVCHAMYQMMKPGDEILHTTPSGLSSTIQIRYHL